MNPEITTDKKKAVLGPGRLLRLAREEKNLRPEDIAFEIRLTASQVLALDEDDYSNMPEETYVRGYLRNYARLVGVPENDILMAFNRFTRAEEMVAAPPVVPLITEAKPVNRSLLIAVGLGLLAVIVLSTIWVMNPVGESSQPEALPAVVEKELETTIEEVPVGTSTLNLQNVAENTDLDTSPIPPKNEKSLTSETEAKNVIDPPVPDKQAVIAPTPVIKPVNEKRAILAGGVLTISYNKDSWTDVRDANGVKLLYRTVKAGEKIALKGILPISLFFGFAQGVEVIFNGKVIDVSSHTRGVYARFTVGDTVNQ